jgi:hypothetical protein
MTATIKAPKNHDEAWTTTDEISWIERIGVTLNEREGVIAGTKRQYLQGYIKGATQRVDWRGINGAACILRARELLGVSGL